MKLIQIGAIAWLVYAGVLISAGFYTMTTGNPTPITSVDRNVVVYPDWVRGQ